MSDVHADPSSADPNGEYSESSVGEQDSNEPTGEGRTLDNVRGELLRKHEKLAEQVRGLYDMLDERLPKPAEQQVSPPPQQPWQQRYNQPNQQVYAPGPVSPFGAPRGELSQFDDASLNQALQHPALTEPQRAAIRDELAVRGQTRLLESMFEKRDAEIKRNSQKEKSQADAFAQFPALRDKNSEFSKKVLGALNERRKQFGEFPTDLYDVANLVAREMNVEVTRAASGYVAPGSGGAKPAEKPAEAETMTDEQFEALAKKFQNALPIRRNKQGKPERVKFNKDRIKERSSVYKQSEAFYKNKKVAG